MRTVALVLLLIGCSGPAFEPELFAKSERDSERQIDVQSDVRDGGAESDTPDTVAPDTFDADCSNRHLIFIGTSGSLAKFSAPKPLTIFVEARVLLEPGDSELAIEHHGPENPCGFSFTIRETTVKATLPAQFDHYAPVQVASTGWKHVRWSFDGNESKIFVDGQLESSQKFAASLVECSGSVTLGSSSVPGSAPHGWNRGRIDDLVVGGYRWRFDEPSGPELFGNPGPSGTLQGDVRRDCGP